LKICFKISATNNFINVLYLEKAINSKHNFENGLKFELNLDWIKIALGFGIYARV